jgi:hypothetical protein
MEKDREVQSKKNEQLGQLKDLLRERLNGSKRESINPTLKLNQQIDIEKELEKLNTERKVQEEKAQSEIKELVEKLKETRAKLLETQRLAINVPVELSQHSTGDKAKIESLTKNLSIIQKELEYTKEQLEAVLKDNNNKDLEISNHKKHIMDLEERNKELEVRILEQPIMEEMKYSEQQLSSQVEFPEVEVNQEVHKVYEENVGNEAREVTEENNRGEDVSAESGSTALIEKRHKNEDKKYESTEEFGNTIEHNPIEQKEESGIPSNENAGDQRDFFNEPNNPLEEHGTLPTFGDSNDFFDNIALNPSLQQVSNAPQQTSQTSSVKRSVVPDDLF